MQIFPEHDELSDRYTRTLYYGKLPATDRPSLPLTQLAVDQFTQFDGLGSKLGRLDVARAAEMTRTVCAGPSSLVVALLYLDRLRRRNPDYLTSVSSADLFLVSMMVASKFLHDDGEEDEVFNDEWAQSGGMETKEINQLEINFLSALDWRIFVNTEEFQSAVVTVERDISLKQVAARCGDLATYTELTVLSGHPAVKDIWRMVVELSVKMSAVCAAAYTAGLLSLLATTALLERTPAGPAAVSSSVRTLQELLEASPAPRSHRDSHLDTVPDTGLSLDSLDEAADLMEELTVAQPRVTAADLLTASLLVTSLSSGMSAPITSDVFASDNDTAADGGNQDAASSNYSRSLWLAEVAFGDRENATHNYDYQPGHWAGADSYNTRSTGPDFDHLAVKWKNSLLLDQKRSRSALSSLLGRCPVLRWGSSWFPDHDRFLDLQPVTFIPLHG